MAQRVSIELVDDLDGSEAAETVTFALDGRHYELDLSEKNAAKLRKALDQYVANARAIKPNGARPAAKKRGGSADTKAVREWAAQNGFKVAAQGRVPADVMDAYAAAHN